MLIDKDSLLKQAVCIVGNDDNIHLAVPQGAVIAAQTPWRKVEDGLPPMDEFCRKYMSDTVLGRKGYSIYYGYFVQYDDGEWEFLCADEDLHIRRTTDITHWMSLTGVL